MSLSTADMGAFFSDFADDVEPLTWGTGAFRGIVDRIEVDSATGSGLSVSRWRHTILTASANIPSTAANGDQLRVNGTTYKIVDMQEQEVGTTLIVLGRVT